MVVVTMVVVLVVVIAVVVVGEKSNYEHNSDYDSTFLVHDIYFLKSKDTVKSCTLW